MFCRGVVEDILVVVQGLVDNARFVSCMVSHKGVSVTEGSRCSWVPSVF